MRAEVIPPAGGPTAHAEAGRPDYLKATDVREQVILAVAGFCENLP